MEKITEEFRSLKEVERTLESTKNFVDNEQVYIFIGPLRYLYNENKQLKEVINEARAKLKHIIDYLEKQDMFHNYESELLDILTKYKGDNNE